jgi:hypothetical protein
MRVEVEDIYEDFRDVSSHIFTNYLNSAEQIVTQKLFLFQGDYLYFKLKLAFKSR